MVSNTEYNSSLCGISVFSFILADDMGLGKTLTMLCLVLRHKELVQSGYLMKDFEFNEEQKEENDDAGWLSKDSSELLLMNVMNAVRLIFVWFWI